MNQCLFLLTSFVFLAFQRSEGYQTYCNSKYDYCIRYPKTFQMQEKSENGDGAFFISDDKKAEIWAYGRLAVEDLNELEQEFGLATEKIRVTYQIKKATWFVFSGTDAKNNVIYQKTVKKNIEFFGDKETPAFQTLRLSYPPDQKKKYDAYCKLIARSF